MQLEQTLRDALQRDAADLVPVGRGPDHARRRAFRRKRRIQSGVVVIGAAGLVGGSLAVIETRPSGHAPRITTQPAPPTSDLAWRTVDGTVLIQGRQFTSSDGVTYALSTAPGTRPLAGGAGGSGPQELYATRDGVSWTHTSLGPNPWVADIAESKGVLYAVGTGPGAQAGATVYRLSTSTDSGAHWNDGSVPVEFKTPESTVPIALATRVMVARGLHTTVVMAKASYWPNLSSVLGSEANYNATVDGVQILDTSSCKQTDGPTCVYRVVSTRPWSDFGISDPAALHQQEAFVRDDGGSWQRVSLPTDSTTTVLDVTATSNGFLMAEQETLTPGLGTVRLWSSSDGRSWSRLAGAVPRFDAVAISGDRIVGTDSVSSSVVVSNDGGATWIATDNIAALLPSGGALQTFGPISNGTSDAGPLGYAVIVRTNGQGGAHTYLLHSGDGATWKVTDLGAEGAPSNDGVVSVTVGADHIDVSYEVAATRDPDGTPASYKLVDLLGTPKA